MLDFVSGSAASVIIGVFGGLLLGLATRLGRFCTLGAIEDLHLAGDTTRIRMWGVALGASILLVHLCMALGWLDAGASQYLTLAPDVAAAAIGGLTFGVGMALAGNCGLGALARLGSGEIRSFVIVVVMGLAALATLSGPLAPARVALFPQDVASEPASLAHGLGSAFGVPASVIGAGLGLALLAVSLRGASRRALWGLPVALAIVSGFVGTTLVAAQSFDIVPVRSHTFSAPLGETMVWLMLSSGVAPGFGVGSVLGVLAGACAGSLIRGVFRWEACDDHRELRRQIGGAVLMGVGAVIAVGCSVGQGLSAFALLAYTAPITLTCIWLGGVVGLKLMIEGRAGFFRA
ncbi:putative inner membrane protein [Roseivivax jejudonensis]|uniref:Putative inner membrane protein n=1 Tax=Roseivivax jejudonensis TaxID=1529041 RepID=A0A1X6YVX6_9RHOB|nr:YeeE/YedE family protein [Roseivivax jejudonensis]SLN32731.1 putative inner membrane protein [Roseivivax jejudonensis]